MKTGSRAFWPLAIASVVATLSIADLAAAQSKDATKSQKTSPAAFEAEKCRAYLHFSELQSRLIFEDLERLTKLRAERTSVLGHALPSSNMATADNQTTSSIATANPELLKIYNSQIDKIETELPPRRTLLVATNYLFRKCILGLRQYADAGKESESRKRKR